MQNIKLIFHLVSQCSNNKFLFELKPLKWKHVKKQTVFSKHEIMNRILYSLLAYFIAIQIEQLPFEIAIAKLDRPFPPIFIFDLR